MSEIVLIRVQATLEPGRAGLYHLSDHEQKIAEGPMDPDVGLKDYVHDKIEDELAKGNRYFILDMAFVKWVSSTEMGMILSWYRVLTKNEGELVLANLNENIKDVMKITRLDTILQSFDWLTDAQRYFVEKES